MARTNTSSHPTKHLRPNGLGPLRGQQRKLLLQTEASAKRLKRTSTPPRPAFRNRSTADLAQMDCGGHGAHGAEHHSFTGVTMGAPLPFSNTTTNLAGSVLLALRPTT